ncbi:MAG TPA: TonB-dependent receptor [Bradyrhizobium sp.]|uniref:TonB-dependent receptor plug domain-containing protein n=1 Tax=Bradyrhizobium sp. TaxID=376 RepID=UPI002D7F7E22|nr:TonB-dependent receptor [Bradyrhizobium sp.]HET7887060.1 TonB-dependent receptor [Bradyrhizobium sp.]
MPFIITIRARRRFWLASTVLIPLSPFALSATHAQQSASPDLLPPVQVSPPKRVETARPLPEQKPKRRQAAAKPAPKPPQQPAGPQPGVPNSGQNVVSPTGIVTPINQVANSVTVITAQDIATQQYRTVPDALNTVPGLNLVQSGGMGAQASVFMRGTNSNQTKVLVDGVDVSDPRTGTFDFAHLLTADMAQIEILRGPQSGLYGSDAIGGVISIITQKGEGPARWTALSEAGSFGTFNQSIGVSGSQDNVNYAASVSHVHASDIPVTPLQLLPPGQQANGNSYDNMTYSTKTGVDLSDSLTWNSVLRYSESTLFFTGNNTPNADFTVFFPDAQQSQQTVHQFTGREEAVWSLLDGRVKNYFGVNYTNYWHADITPGVDLTAVTTGNRVKYDWHSVAEVAPGQNLIVGAERENSNLNTTDLSAKTGNSAGFVEWQSNFAQRFFLTANIREDDNDNFGQHMTYRIAPAVLVPFTDTKLKASYGTGFKAPTLSELFEFFPGFSIPNPDLKPEQSRGADIGFEQPLFNDRIRFGSTYFKNDITDLIFFEPIPGSFLGQNVNIGHAITEGTENFATFNAIDRVKVRADYTFTRTVDADTGLQLLRRPKEKFSVTALWNPIDPLTLSATVLHVSDWSDIDRNTGAPLTAPGYTIVNLRSDYAINDQLKLFGRIDNVANVHYQNPTGFLAPGLGVFGGVRFASYGVK